MSRPKIPEAAKRPRIITTIAPETRQLLLADRRPEDPGLGAVIDRWARLAHPDKPR